MAAPHNPNTAPARRAKKTKARVLAENAGTLEALRLKVWRCLNRVEEILVDETADPLVTLKAVHAFTQATGCYIKLTEAGEFEARLEALEAAVKPPGSKNGTYR